MEKNIVLAKLQEDQVNNLEYLIETHFKDKLKTSEINHIMVHSSFMDLLILCSDNPQPEEIEILKNNYLVPVIMLSDKPQNELIQKYNIYRSLKGVTPEIIDVIKDAFASKNRIEQAFGGQRPDLFFMSTSLTEFLRKRVESAAKEGKIMSLYEALYTHIMENPTALSQVAKGPQEIVLDSLNFYIIPYLEEYEKTGNADRIAEAERNFLPLLPVLKNIEDEHRKNGSTYELIQFLVGGSTLSEQGSRYLININLRKKYDITKGDHKGYFIRDVQNRKEIDHKFIAQIRYDVVKHIQEYYRSRKREESIHQEVGKFPKMYYPLKYPTVSFIIQEALIGPDLEYVFLKIKETLVKVNKLSDVQKEIESTLKSNASDKQLVSQLMGRLMDIKSELSTLPNCTLLKKMREELTKKYLSDLAGWQKSTAKLVAESAEIRKNSEDIANYFQENVKKIPQPYAQKFSIFTPKELELWNLCANYVNQTTFGLSKKNLVLSLDASSKNAKLQIGKYFPSMDEIIDAVTNQSGAQRSISVEKIDNSFYHVDTGYIATHYLEDFFHIVDGFEAADDGATTEQILRNTKEWQKYFLKKSNRYAKNEDSRSKIALYLCGAYRNLRRAYLSINEFQTKNVQFAREGRIKEYTYSNFRRSYEDMNKHHVNRAVIYLDELHNHFVKEMNNTGIDHEETFRKYETIILPFAQLGTDESVNNVINTLAELNKKKSESTRKKRAYFCAMLYGSMNYCMARLAEKMGGIKLPKYESIMQGEKK
ncbi:MAG: hypothetical protein QW666_03100 [Candidatus Woesearchaeota archaeon]